MVYWKGHGRGSGCRALHKCILFGLNDVNCWGKASNSGWVKTIIPKRYFSKSVHWQTMRLHLYSISDSFEEFIDVAVEFERVEVVFSRGTVDIAWSKR